MTEQENINLNFSTKIDRSELLNISSWALQKIADRLAVKRFREKETDPTELKFYRILFAGISTHAQIIKDEELDEIEKRLKNLEEIANEKRY